MGGGPKPNTNVPNVDVPKWLWSGGVRPNRDDVLKSVFFILKASLSGIKFVLNSLFIYPTDQPTLLENDSNIGHGKPCFRIYSSPKLISIAITVHLVLRFESIMVDYEIFG